MPTSDSGPKQTPRAYTLRLRGLSRQDNTWRDALWATHEAVNKGAKAFGDWMLTLRGGLDHALVDTKVKGGKGKPDRDPTDKERRERRVLLALSWLSVESELGAPDGHIVASGKEPPGNRNGKVVAALEKILKSRGLADHEINEWKDDCSASLSAAIRDDAVWVNRSNAFDDVVNSIGQSLTREEVWDMLGPFFGGPESYLAPAKGSEGDSSDAGQVEKAKDLVTKAGQWLSSRFGIGEGADFKRMACVYEKIAAWAGKVQGGMAGNEAISDLAAALSEFTPASGDCKGVLGLVSGTGHKSATRNLLKQLATDEATVTQEDLKKLKEKAAEDKGKCEKNAGSKGQRAYSDAILKDVESVCGFTYLEDGGRARHSEFAVILDHAARHVSLVHTWIKRAEAERRRFEGDIQKLDSVPDRVKESLDSYCSERSKTSGALEPYRIRRRAVDGWKEVVVAWSKSSCNTAENRIAEARALQREPEKSGDTQLFEALAQDDAVCVWHENGDVTKAADHQSLIDYVSASEAEFKKRHFKVPAYRHPDPLLHPVFCDFGNSRFRIRYDIHEDQKKKDSKAKVTRIPTPQHTDIHKDQKKKDSKGLSLTLWTGNEMKRVNVSWQSKRLARDLAFGQAAQNGEPHEVARADRLGRVASNATENDEAKISRIFEQKHWNGRLQAPRRQLEAIAAVRGNPDLSDQERSRRLAHLLGRIRWSVTFSAKLQPFGPWLDYAKKHGLKTDPKYWPHSELNKARKGQARIVLSRLPGLRVLSVDLGHRHAAACAVWETISAEQVKKECQVAGHEPPKDSDLYLYLKRKATMQKKGRPVEVEETTIYRRIGPDTLPDGTCHPAPWARLDRQFLIKLQGEEGNIREASNEEIWKVHQLEEELGRTDPIINQLVKGGWGQSGKQRARLEGLLKLGWTPPIGTRVSGGTDADEGGAHKPSLSVDELMFSAVRTMRLALRRHGDRARIAHYLTADVKTKPGGIKVPLDNEGRIELLKDALVIWHDLFSSRGWWDEAARQLWESHISVLPGYKVPEKRGEDIPPRERKKEREENRDSLSDVAKALAQEADLRKMLNESWRKRWETDDEHWKVMLRWFRDWVLPRGRHASDPGIRRVGGLSLTRLAALTEFRRKVQVGFFTRLYPDGTRVETKERFGQKTLDSLERLREQRVKQLTSRIAEAALGIGRVERPAGGKDPKRPTGRVDEPCHAVVIENLTHYRPEETRTRPENRRLMTWSSSKVKKYLAEACELHGLHLREVSASYTSRQDSRTGKPGIRCQDVSIKEFMRSVFWRKQVAQAEKKRAERSGDARERFLCDLNAEWKGKSEADWANAGSVRIPLNGGEIFVSADPSSPAAKGLQADLNAAANIGLRALTDPDWPGKWWYVLCESKSYKASPDKVKGSDAFKLGLPLVASAADSGKTTLKRAGKAKPGSKEVLNLWRDITSESVNSSGEEWEPSSKYWNRVQAQVVKTLRKMAGLNGTQW